MIEEKIPSSGVGVLGLPGPRSLLAEPSWLRLLGIAEAMVEL